MLAQNGSYQAAIGKYEKLSLQYPDNVDYIFGEAQARFWSGDKDGALQLLPRARRLAPSYEGVWRLEYQVLNSLRGPDARQRIEALRSAARQRFPGASWLHVEPSVETPTIHWEAGFNRETLDNAAADWQNVYAYIDRRSPTDTLMYLTVTEHRRFSLTDNELGIGGSFKPSEHWVVNGALRLSPNAEFLPETVTDMGVSRVLNDGWIAGIDVRHRRYADDTVNTYGLKIERYFDKFRAAYRLDSTQLGSASSFMQSGVLNYYSDSGSQYGLTVAAGDEVEIVAPGQLLEMDISAVALAGRHPLGEHLSIHWRIGTHRQGAIYRRNNVGLSIAGEF
jgi:YaiO family outer membrane protein